MQGGSQRLVNGYHDNGPQSCRGWTVGKQKAFTHDDAIGILVGRDHLGLKRGKGSCNMAGLQQRKHLLPQQYPDCRGCAPGTLGFGGALISTDSYATTQAIIWESQAHQAKLAWLLMLHMAGSLWCP